MTRGLLIPLYQTPERLVISIDACTHLLLCLVAQSCLDSLRPMDWSPPGSSVHGGSQGKNIGVGCHALLQGIFPTQGLNPSLPYCRWILYHLSHQGSPGAYAIRVSGTGGQDFYLPRWFSSPPEVEKHSPLGASDGWRLLELNANRYVWVPGHL